MVVTVVPRVEAVDDRHAPRHEVTVPDGAVVRDIPSLGRGTAFDPSITAIVNAMTSATFFDHVSDLSGATSTLVGGSPVTMHTRYSLTAAGEVCWQYAFEALQAMGYSVVYQNYTRSGFQLRNVVATLPGQVTPERVYVLGGHIDSTSPNPTTNAPGAEDNGSGSSGILTAAAALAGHQFESTIELVLFSAEEVGLWGSEAYVDDAINQGKDVRAAVTFDMIAYHTNEYGVLIEGQNPWVSLMNTMADAVDAFTTLDRQYSFFSFGSDHVSFQDAGIPAILAIDLDWDEYPYYHRVTDTADKIDPDFGVQIARAGVATIAHLAGPMSTVNAPESAPVASVLRVFPNPVVASLSVDFVSDDATEVTVYDVAGRAVRTLTPSTPARVSWDLRDATGRRVSPGTYWLRMGDTSERVVVLP